VSCVQVYKADWLKPMGLVPPLVSTGLLVYGLWQLGSFQRQERVWRGALDQARVLGLVILGLCPFLYWANKVPSNMFFLRMVVVVGFAALLFLRSLNVVLWRLGAMLPDEALRQETRQFTALNLSLLGVTLLLSIAYVGSHFLRFSNSRLQTIQGYIVMEGGWFLVLMILLPLAMTMALLWKTKEVILDSVFGPK
jgi:hypothetical protein